MPPPDSNGAPTPSARAAPEPAGDVPALSRASAAPGIPPEGTTAGLIVPPADEAQEPDSLPPEARDGFRVDNLSTADWCLQRIRDLEEEEAEAEQMFEARTKPLAVARDRIVERAQRGAAWFRAQLETWANSPEGHATLLKGGKAKSRSLLSGRLGWRKKPGDFEVTDAEALLEWAQTQPVELGLIEYTPRLKKAALWKLMKEQPALWPPGVEVREERETFYVETTKAITKGDA